VTRYIAEGDTILDVGCGDMKFWNGRYLPNYTGIDISGTAVEQARSLGYNVLCGDALISEFEPRDVVLCLNVLFHLMSVDDFRLMLSNLNSWTRKYLIVTNWCREPEQYNRHYQQFTPLRDHLDRLSGLRIVESSVCPAHSFLKLYVFERKVKR
jgi:SAM-dependent methyltransferase